MLALIPFFIKEDSFSWKEPEHNKIILNLLNAVKGSKQIHRLLVITDNQFIKDLSISVKIDSFLVEQDKEYLNSEFLPQGTLQCIKTLKSILEHSLEHVIVLNMRNPFITSELINSAITEYYKGNSSSMVSVVCSKENPCQLEACYKVEDVGLIHFLDNMNRNGYSRLKTMPFPFDWTLKGIKKAEKGDVFFQKFKKDKLLYSPYNNTNDKHISCSVNLWAYEDQYRARILFNIDNQHFVERINLGKRGILSGVAFWENTVTTLIYSDHNEYHLYFNSELFSKDVSILRIMPITINGPLEDNIQEYFISNISEKVSFKLPDIELTGIAFYLLKPADNGYCDFTEPFPPDDRLWINTEPKINVKTGKEILGRQDFPEIFEPDKSIMITRWDNISEIKTGIDITKAMPFIMPENNSILIETEFDYLIYRAIIKAQNA